MEGRGEGEDEVRRQTHRNSPLKFIFADHICLACNSSILSKHLLSLLV